MGKGTVNKVQLIGNVGQDPDVRYQPSGNPVVNLNLATDDSYRDRSTGQMIPQTDWHRVVLFGKVAEIAAQYVKKGYKIYVEGRMKTRKWQGQDGQDRYTTEVVVDPFKGTLEMLDSRPAGGAPGHSTPPQGQARPQSSAPHASQSQSPDPSTYPEPVGAGGGMGDWDDYDIPL